MSPRAIASVLAALLAAGALFVPATAATPAAPAATKPPAPAQRDPARGAWLRLDTPNFTLFGDVPEARLRAIGARVEAFRGTLEALHPGSTPSPRETAIYVFTSADRGWPFTPRDAGGAGHLGVNLPYDARNYVTVAAPMDDPPLDLLYHAYAHQFLDDGFPRLPLLVTEGLAGFYTGFGVIPEGTLAGMVNSDHVRWMREHAEWSLSAQIGLDAAALRAAPAIERQTFVAGSWALVHYLVSGSGERRAGVPAFLEALQRGTPAGAAATAAFGVDLEGLQAAVGQYIQANRFLPLRTTDTRAKPDAGAFRPTPLARDAVLAALGDLIAHGGSKNDADAEAYFQEALRLNPRQARAHAGLGDLRYARERYAEAIPALEQAVDIDADAMSCYLLARSILKVNAGVLPAAGAPPAWMVQARILLARATLLRPGFAAPYVTLGSTHIRPDGEARSGIEALEKARALLPARTDIAGNLVYLYLRAGDLPRAQAMTDRVIAPSGDAEALRAAHAAIATYKQDLAARQDVDRLRVRRTPAEEARAREFNTRLLQSLRDALETVEDPEQRKRNEAEIARLERQLQPGAKEPILVYNEAIAYANNRDYAKAIAMLEELLAQDVGPNLSAEIKTTLARLRQDAARYQKAAP